MLPQLAQMQPDLNQMQALLVRKLFPTSACLSWHQNMVAVVLLLYIRHFAECSRIPPSLSPILINLFATAATPLLARIMPV